MSERIGEKIDIDGTIIYYERVGSGERKILLLPGVLGTIELDFNQQMNGLDTSKLTLICWDPPGYGKSRPPEKVYDNWYQIDAELAAKFMNKLQIDKYSILGFSDGARTALVLSAKYPERVERLVICGCSTYITPKERKTLTLLKDVSGWGYERRAIYEEVYGDSLQTIWSNWINAMTKLNHFIEKDILTKIVCPTYIFHGEKDVLVACDPHANYLKNNIRDTRMHIFKGMPHPCHQEKSNEFNLKVQEFFLRDNS